MVESSSRSEVNGSRRGKSKKLSEALLQLKQESIQGNLGNLFLFHKFPESFPARVYQIAPKALLQSTKKALT